MLSFTLKFADCSPKKAKIDDETCTAQYETPKTQNQKRQQEPAEALTPRKQLKETERHTRLLCTKIY